MGTSRLRLDRSESIPAAPRTPGSLGVNDAADPNVARGIGDSPGPLGIKDAGEQLSRFEAPRLKTKPSQPPEIAASTPKAYVILPDALRGRLTSQIWEQARLRINDLFRNAGGQQAIYVSKSKPLPKINLIDSVVECCWDSAAASTTFQQTVLGQLKANTAEVPELESFAKTFNQPDHYSVSEGRSYTIKGVFHVSLLARPKLICITFSVISVRAAFARWAGILKAKTATTLQTINSAPLAEQEAFGMTLGSLIAHELRHQYALVPTGVALSPTSHGLGHTSHGLSKEEADFPDPKLRFADESTIRANVAKLRQVQEDFEWSQL